MFLASKRNILKAIAVASIFPTLVEAKVNEIAIDVWKDPSCGCCKEWVTYLNNAGFLCKVYDEGNAAARARFKMPTRFGSCHTGFVQGYVIEGHVPAADILRLLKEKPTALGLAVPGMPIGSPGMDGPIYKGRRDAFKVLLIQKDGSDRQFSQYSKIG